MSRNHELSIRLVVFDWAGTTIDFGCFAPVVPFVEGFRRLGVEITMAEARAPMGLGKFDHLRAIAAMPEVAARCRQTLGRDLRPDELETTFREHFIPLQMEVLGRHSELVPGIVECAAELRRRGIAIGSSTGYLREMSDRVVEAARKQGYAPDHNVSGSDVPAGRPAPWMIHRNMEALGVYPPAAVLKVGDTIPDIEEGLSAGCWSVGVTDSSNLLGLSRQEFDFLDPAERARRVAGAAETLRAAGAHDVLATVAEVPALIDRLNERLARGERP